MKKNALIVCLVLTTISLTTYGCKNQNSSTNEKEVCCKHSENEKEIKRNPDFQYDLDSRFIATISKENIKNAQSVIDLVPREGTKGIVSFSNVKISELSEEGERNEKGNDEKLNNAQHKLLNSLDYSANFYIEALCQIKNSETGELGDYNFVYYVTIVPEHEAEYKEGHSILLEYLLKNSLKETKHTKVDDLEPGKVLFTVTKEGKIANTVLESTSGYKSIDTKMLELIKNIPGEWNSAKNSTGDKVDQELVFSFGIIGC